MRTNTSLMRAFVVFFSLLLGYGSLNAQNISTICGNGTNTSTGDGGLATAATTNFPTHMVVLGNGDKYIAEYAGNRIRKITAATGIITTIVGTGTAGYTGDGGLATSAQINNVTGMQVDANQDIYFSQDNVIRKVTISTGIITTIAGTGTSSFSGDGGAAISATFFSISSIDIDASGNIYLADRNNKRIRKIAASTNIVTTIAGTGVTGFSGDGGAATSATLDNIFGIALDPSGNLYLSLFGGSRIRKITTSTGIITTVAGTGTSSFSGDGGLATAATLNNPFGIDVNTSGDVFIADRSNLRIRKITVSTGIITTVAGNGSSFGGDGGLATAAGLYSNGVCISGTDIYIPDSFNQRIRQIISCPTITISPASLAGGTVGTAYSQTVTQTGLAGTPIWSVSVGTLPAGVTLAGATGIISGTPTAAGTANITVSVTDGTCTQTKTYSIVVACPTLVFGVTSATSATVGTAYSLNAGVTGNTQSVVYTVSSLPAGLSIASATGIISGTPTTPTASATYTVTATQGTCSLTRGYTFAVVCPTTTVTPTLTAQSYVVGTTISSITLGASGVSGATYAYAVTSGALPAGVTLSAGVISGTPTTATAATSFTITATASIGGCTGTAVYNYSVVCPTLVFGVTSATGATVGTAYSLNAGVTGNTQSVVYTVSSLPAGLAIASTTGIISGTPTVPTASATYTVTATQGTCSLTQGYTFAVVCAGITINPATLVNGTIGTAYTQTLTQIGLSGTPAWSVSVGTLPAGITLASATGVISGTPTTTGTTNFTISLTNGAGCTQTKTYSIVVVCPTLVFGVTTASGATVAAAYSLNAGVTGNTGTIVYSVLPTLPAGLSINTATGVISGTPTAVTPSATYVVTATQTVACFATQSYTFAVIPNCTPVVLGAAGLADAIVGTPYTHTFTATGGSVGATYTFSTSVALPAGLSLDASTGVISGTPTLPTTLTFLITAKTPAPNNCSTTIGYNLTVRLNAITSVDNSLANLVKVSPNPSSGDFNVDFGTINMAKSSVRVYDAQGKVVFTSENNSNLMTISLDKFANGIYLMEVETSKGRILKRLAKQ